MKIARMKKKGEINRQEKERKKTKRKSKERWWNDRISDEQTVSPDKKRLLNCNANFNWQFLKLKTNGKKKLFIN